MNNMFKADMYRLTHSIVFYVSIIFITIMAVALPLSGMTTTLDGALGAAASDDFMAAAMGASVINILLSIILSIFVCGDYSGGFAKNIFTVHADPKAYIGGKLMSMGVTSAFLLVLYTIEAAVATMVFTGSLAMNGTILGLLVFLIEKWILSLAMSALILLVLLFTRNMAWGIFAGFLIATGGLAMGISLFAEWLGWHWLTTIFSVTISGASALCSLVFSPLVLVRVLLAGGVWLVISCVTGKTVLAGKDI